MRKKRFLGILLSIVLMLGLMPGMSLTAYAENESTAPYPLWVGETQVTSMNAGDVLGDGTVRFTPAEGENPAILILNGVNITTGYSATGIRYEGADALNIELEDGSDNSIIKDAGSEFFIGFASIDPEADVIISGTGKLTVDSAGGGIFCERNVAITGGTVTASSSSYGYGIASFQGDVTITGGTVTASAAGDMGDGIYSKGNVTITGGAVTASAAVDTGNGIFSDGGHVMIAGGTVTASGTDQGISGIVKNSIAGTGWTDTAGTRGKANIAVSADGQELSSYRKVQFPSSEPTPTPEPTPEPAPEEKLPFIDVKSGDWFYDSVDYVFNHNIMTGKTPTYFGAVENLSRAQFATIIYRIAGEPPVTEKQIFPDVPITEGTKWYADAVVWAYENKIVLGYINGNFGPADPITREQMVVMMYRYAKNPGYNGGSLEVFPDASKVSAWAMDAMEWAVGTGIITGDKGKINPQGKMSRAVCATILQRYDNTHKDAAALVEDAKELIAAEKYEEALVPLLKAVEVGNAEAQFNLGVFYLYGFGVEQDFEEALKYLRSAAEQGLDKAQCELGTMYEFGEGVELSYEKAMEYYQLAADQGYGGALNNIGNLYECGHGVEQDYEKALEYYTAAIEAGLTFGYWSLGSLYENGYGVEQDYEKAAEYYRIAADMGIQEAADHLEKMKEEGLIAAE